MLWPQGQSMLGKPGCAYSTRLDEMQQLCSAALQRLARSMLKPPALLQDLLNLTKQSAQHGPASTSCFYGV